jgi:peptide/nickel transport system substrate-binding protein
LLLVGSLAFAGGKNLNIALFWLDENIEPTEGWNGWTLTRTGVGENLAQIDENLKIKPVIAESWEQIDPTTTVFKIRKGVYFQNGQLVDASACKASIERAHSITNRKDMKFPLESITAEGNTLTIKTTKPYSILTNILADPVYIIVDAKAAFKDPEGFKVKPICTGPFKVITFAPDKGLTLEKHGKYWKGVPDVDTIAVKYLPDGSTRTMALQSGEIDLATALNANDLKLFEDKDKFIVKKGPNLRVFQLKLNFERPYMKNLKFRQALIHGIDKDVYATKLAGGVPARGPFNSMLPFGYKGDEYYAYDPQKAKKLLDEVGFVDNDGDGIREMNGKNIVMEYIFSTNHGKKAQSIGTAMQSQYKAIGLGLKLIQLESIVELGKKGKFDLKFERWTSAPTADPQYFLEASFKTEGYLNEGRYSNPEFDALCDKLGDAYDKAKRYELGIEATKILLEDIPGIFLFYGMGNVVTNQKVDGVYRFISEVYYIDDRVKLK